MAFEKKIWLPRISEFAGRRKLTNTRTGEENIYDVTRYEGEVQQNGTAFSTANMNDLEQRIADGFASVADSLSVRYDEESGYIQVYDNDEWKNAIQTGLKEKILFKNNAYYDGLDGFTNILEKTTTPPVTINTNGITISTSNGISWKGFAMLCSTNIVNFAGHKKLSVKVTNTNISAKASTTAMLWITNSRKTVDPSVKGDVMPYGIITSKEILNTVNNSEQTFTLNLNNIEQGYIVFLNNGEFEKASSITISEIWLHD